MERSHLSGLLWSEVVGQGGVNCMDVPIQRTGLIDTLSKCPLDGAHSPLSETIGLRVVDGYDAVVNPQTQQQLVELSFEL